MYEQQQYDMPTSPDAEKARQMAQETWRRQQEDVLRRQQQQANSQIKNSSNNGRTPTPPSYQPRQQQSIPPQWQQTPRSYPMDPYATMYRQGMRPPVPASATDTRRVAAPATFGSIHKMNLELNKLKKQVQEMRKYFKFWVRKEGQTRTRNATKIQSVVRSYLSRRSLYMNNPRFRKIHTKNIANKTSTTDEERLKKQYPTINSLILPAVWSDQLYRKSKQGNPTGASEIDHSATHIQRIYRGYKIRKLLSLIKLQKEAILKLQSRWRGYIIRKPKRTHIRGNDNNMTTVISSSQLANLYTTIDALRKENKLQKQRSDAQEKALRILWEEVRKIKERREDD